MPSPPLAIVAPGLLVSVIDPAEAICAVAGGADVIDVKQPLRGPLGRQDAQVVRRVVAVVAGRRPVTAAGGELGELAPLPFAEWATNAGAAVVKVGVRTLDPAALALLESLRAVLPAAIGLAPTLYADLLPAPGAAGLASLRDAARADWVVVDTHDKQRGSLLDAWTCDTIKHFAATAHGQCLRVALAGRLSAGQLGVALHCGGDLVGVRGAACAGGRAGRVRSSLVSALAQHVHPANERCDKPDSPKPEEGKKLDTARPIRILRTVAE